MHPLRALDEWALTSARDLRGHGYEEAEASLCVGKRSLRLRDRNSFERRKAGHAVGHFVNDAEFRGRRTNPVLFLALISSQASCYSSRLLMRTNGLGRVNTN